MILSHFVYLIELDKNLLILKKFDWVFTLQVVLSYYSLRNSPIFTMTVNFFTNNEFSYQRDSPAGDNYIFLINKSLRMPYSAVTLVTCHENAVTHLTMYLSCAIQLISVNSNTTGTVLGLSLHYWPVVPLHFKNPQTSEKPCSIR